MLIKRIIAALLLGFVMISSAYAGKEDWTGTFTVHDSAGGTNTVQHTPTGVSFLFFSAGECMHFGKGTNVNGIVFKDDVNLCRDSNVATFAAEVAKIGFIVNQKITLGPTYKD